MTKVIEISKGAKKKFSDEEVGYFECILDLTRTLEEANIETKDLILNRVYLLGQSRYPYLFTRAKNEEAY